MRLALLCFLAGLAVQDPEGTVVLNLDIGRSALVPAAADSNIICDDPSVASGDFGPDGKGFVIRAHKPGSTLCGVWAGHQVPGGLYRVNVRDVPAQPK